MELLLTSVISLAIGLIIGFVASRLFSANGKKTLSMEKHLKETETKLKDYQLDVNHHFEKTAHLLDELNESYRAVHNHLADASHSLSDTPPNTSASIQTIPSKEQIEAIAEPKSSTDTIPPLDYAPKASPHEPGMLDESFGIEEQPKIEEEPIQRAI